MSYVTSDLDFRILGHVGGSYSLAAVNRDLALALAAMRPGRVRLQSAPGGSWREWLRLPPGQRRALWSLRLPRRRRGLEVTIAQHYPLHVPDQRGDVCLALFFWEESRVPQPTIAQLNAGFDAVLAPTRFVAAALERSGLEIPVHVVGLAPDLEPFLQLERAPVRDVTRFVHVSSGFPRKGIDVLLRAYAAAFRRGDPVELVIKTFPNPHNQTANQLASLRALVPDMAPVRLIEADLPRAELLDLYRHASAMVLPARGEGFNLPAAEAMAAGVPVIVSAIGGHADFCTAQTARLIGCTMALSRSHLADDASLWAEPDLGQLVQALRESVANGPEIAARVARARETAQEMNAARLVARIEAVVRILLS